MSPNESAPDVPSRETVEGWISAIRREIQTIGERLSPLLAEHQQLKQREALLLSLLNSYDRPSADGQADDQPAASVASLVAPGESVHDYVCTGVRAVLEEAAGPLHINEIHARFIARGLRVPGAGKPANLTAHLTTCEGIISPRRGFYALATGAEGTGAVPARKRRRRRVAGRRRRISIQRRSS